VSGLPRGLGKFFDSAVTSAFGWALFIALVVPLLLVGYQFFRYLESGISPPMSVIDAMVYLRAILPSGVVSWAVQPQSWFGLHSLCLRLPTALAVFLAGLLSVWLISKLPTGSSEE
jgi:hypothetical protein